MDGISPSYIWSLFHFVTKQSAIELFFSYFRDQINIAKTNNPSIIFQVRDSTKKKHLTKKTISVIIFFPNHRESGNERVGIADKTDDISNKSDFVSLSLQSD